jgi:hypothetical protein
MLQVLDLRQSFLTIIENFGLPSSTGILLWAVFPILAFVIIAFLGVLVVVWL